MTNFADMIKNVLIPLVANIGLLSILAWVLFIYGRKIFLRPLIDSTKTPILLGGVFGTVSAIVMFLPIELIPGVITDSRGVPVIFAGIIGGPICAVITAVIGTIVRLLIGGPGWLAGTGLIVAHGVIGLIARHFSRKSQMIPSMWSMVAIAFFATAATAPTILLLPREFQFGVLTQLLPQLLVANIIGSLTLGTLISKVEKRYLLEQEKKRLESELRQSAKMQAIGTLAGGIAHDFNNVLYPIIGFTQMSMEELPRNHPVHENLQDILDGAKRARDLVKQILLFSRQKEQVLKPTILRPVIEETIKLLRSSIPANIYIEQELYDGEDHILCDPTEIHEIVMNLCTNAYHAVEDKDGTIKVGLNKIDPDPELKLPSGDYICLSVRDDGIGIPSDKIDRIFDPYFTTKGIGKGTGLGLSVVHGIVKNYKGDIHVTSSPKKGTAFNIFLPVTDQLGSDQQQHSQDSLGGNEKILFVDDEKSIVKLGVKALSRVGYKITGVHDSSEALALFKSKPDYYDIILTDMTMPGMVGSQLAAKILEIRQDIPIIICTGYSERLDDEKAKKLNVKAFIDKPILIDELITKVRQILDQRDGDDDAKNSP